MAKRIKVTFSDACTDVLVHLAENGGSWWTWHGIRDAIAPEDATDPSGTVLNAMQTLRECGLIEGRSFDGFPGWRITDAGRAAVADATAGSEDYHPSATNGENAGSPNPPEKVT